MLPHMITTSAGYYCADAMAVWIIVQIVTGKVMYRRGTGYRRENPRAFWCFIGLESLIVAPLICYQFHLNSEAMALSLVLFTLLLGFMIYVLWMFVDVISHPKVLWRKLRQDYEQNPKELLRVLLFGR